MTKGIAKGIGLIGRVGAILVWITAIVAAYASMVNAWAGYLGDSGEEDGLRQAQMLVPGNASYLLRMARLDGANRATHLRAAVAANRYLSPAWVDLALAVEMKGNLQEAERLFLEAAAVDRTFGPAWALTNFYYRRQQEEEFWRWAGHSIRMSHGDLTALYRLCAQVSGDPSTAGERIVPREARYLSGYLRYLLGEGALGPAAGIAGELAPVARPEDKYVLLGYCDRMVYRCDVERALRVWNSLAEGGLLPAAYALDPAGGRSVTNGEFRWEPLETAFDWRPGKSDGVRGRFGGRAGGARLALNGNQADWCLLLEQFVPVVPGTDYEVRVRYRGSAISGEGGVLSEVIDCVDGHPLSAPVPMPLSEDWMEGCFGFRNPSGSKMARLRFHYRREEGQVPWNGRLELRSVELVRR